MDARGRKIKINKEITLGTSAYITEETALPIDPVKGNLPRTPEDAFEPNYLNFLPTNGTVLAPQLHGSNDAQTLKDIQTAYPNRAGSSTVAATSAASRSSSPRRAAPRRTRHKADL